MADREQGQVRLRFGWINIIGLIGFVVTLCLMILALLGVIQLG